VASSDLGGLGSKAGSAVTYDWTLPSLAPLFLPWLLILGLLMLQPNRRGEAWWIWLPLGCMAALGSLASSDLLSSSGFGIFFQAAIALAFGFAAVWLLSDYLGRSHRLLTWLCILPTLAGFSILAFVAREGWDSAASEILQVGILLAVSTLAISVALSLTGLLCRSRYRPVGLYLWLLALLAAVWLLVTAPFFIFAMIASGGQIPWLSFFTVVFAVSGLSFAALLPFLILSSCSPLFRERLKMLLNASREVPPPPPTSLPAVDTKT